MRSGFPWLVLSTVFAAATGVALGSALAGGDAPPPADRAAAAPTPTPEPAPRFGLARGPVRLPLPAGWEPLRRHSELPGFKAATAVQAAHSTVALDLRAPEHASLLPLAAARRFPRARPAPEPRRVGTRRVWGYELPGKVDGTRAVSLSLPTTRGVVTIACETDEAELRLGLRECTDAMSAVELDGADALRAAPEAAVRIVLPVTVARLNAERRAGRRSLAATRSPTRRRAAALRVARAYARAAGRLRPLAAGRARRLVATLDTLVRKYRNLGAASARRQPRAAQRSGARIVRGERRLGRRIVRVAGSPG